MSNVNVGDFGIALVSVDSGKAVFIWGDQKQELRLDNSDELNIVVAKSLIRTVGTLSSSGRLAVLNFHHRVAVWIEEDLGLGLMQVYELDPHRLANLINILGLNEERLAEVRLIETFMQKINRPIPVPDGV